MPPRYKKGLSIQQKIEVIHIYDKCHSTSKAAHIYNCSESYIRNIIRRREEYLAEWNNNRYIGLVINEWIGRSKYRGHTVSKKQIIAIGEIIIKKLKLPEIGTMCWLRQGRTRLYSQFRRLTGNINEHKSLEIDDIIQDLRGTLDHMGYREPVTVESQILKPDEINQQLDSDKSAEVDANQIYSITDVEVEETMNNLKVIKTETIDDVEIVDRAIHANEIYSITDDDCEVEETMNNLKVIKTETIDDVEIVDSPIHSNNNNINELELNQPFCDEIQNKKGTNVAGKTYLDAYNHLSCLEVNLLNEADLYGLKLVNDLKKHFLTKIVDIRKNK